MPTDQQNRQIAAMAVPLVLKDPGIMRMRMKLKERGEHAVVCLPTDSFTEVMAKARRYPGWVTILVYYPPPPGVKDQMPVEIREVWPRNPAQAAQTDMTMGEAFRWLAEAELRGDDLLAGDNELARELSMQRAVVPA